MPDATIASAVSRMSCSLISQWNRFQLFHPIRGAGARTSGAAPGAAAGAGTGALRRDGARGNECRGDCQGKGAISRHDVSPGEDRARAEYLRARVHRISELECTVSPSSRAEYLRARVQSDSEL